MILASRSETFLFFFIRWKIIVGMVLETWSNISHLLHVVFHIMFMFQDFTLYLLSFFLTFYLYSHVMLIPTWSRKGSSFFFAEVIEMVCNAWSCPWVHFHPQPIVLPIFIFTLSSYDRLLSRVIYDILPSTQVLLTAFLCLEGPFQPIPLSPPSARIQHQN